MLTIKHVFISSLSALALTGACYTQADNHPAKSDQALIASAMAAAPKAISGEATIVTMNADGTMRTLREGKNGWHCMPDMPNTPGEDPLCADTNAWEWMHAFMTKQTPPDKIGFMYMLKGGVDASNVEPFKEKPDDGKSWLRTGPHVMVVGPAIKTMPGYTKSATPDTSKPYVMFPDTPYEHLMIPVQ